MRPEIREQLANLCYAGILAVVGAIALAISAANQAEPGSLNDNAFTDIAGVIAGLLLFSAVLYLIYGLWRLAEILRQSAEQSD